MNLRDVERVLAGDGSYDALSEPAQAIVRVEWDERIAEGIAGLDFEAEFTAAGRSWTETDEQGNAVARNPKADA